VAHASDRLFHDSVDYIDGCLHLDTYHVQIHHENALPRPPDYPIDTAYFEDRFDVRPWIFEYLAQQSDGPFWRKNALRYRPDAVKVPAFLIGGAARRLPRRRARAAREPALPLRAVMGPWNHSWPDDGLPGPNFEWRHEAVRFWDHWLKDRDTGFMKEPRFAVFVREGNPPDSALKATPGAWRYEDWPIKRAKILELFPTRTRALRPEAARPAEEALRYVPSFGWAAGGWWGEPTPDMRPDDAGAWCSTARAAGGCRDRRLPARAIRAAVDAPLAHFVARIEDVNPDGTVSLVAGGAMNGSQRNDPRSPRRCRSASRSRWSSTSTSRPGRSGWAIGSVSRSRTRSSPCSGRPRTR
jgi:predicted acyl esterase